MISPNPDIPPGLNDNDCVCMCSVCYRTALHAFEPYHIVVSGRWVKNHDRAPWPQCCGSGMEHAYNVNAKWIDRCEEGDAPNEL